MVNSHLLDIVSGVCKRETHLHADNGFMETVVKKDELELVLYIIKTNTWYITRRRINISYIL